MVAELLAGGADPDERFGGKTALMEAADEPGEFFDTRREAVVKALLAAGADVHAQDEAGWTALHYAARADARATELLLGSSADATATAADGTTPLHLAALHANCDVVRALVVAGADPRLPDHSGATPSALARREHTSDEAAAVLEALGAT
jgi:ankyrin repeat protein